MPPPLQLIGQKFGRLSVVAVDPKGKGYWLCHCECGREESIHQRNFEPSRGKSECIVCMRGPCVVCSARIELPGTRMMNTCSDACQIAKKRGLFRDHYYRLVERDPDFNKKVWTQRAEKMATDLEYAAKMKTYWATQREKESANPEFMARQRAASKAHYKKNRDAIIAGRKARRAALSYAERAAVDEAMRRTNREWRRQWRLELSQDPERKAAYALQLQEWRRDAALRRMMAKSLSMTSLLEENSDDSNNDES